MGEMIWRKGEF